jgi:hypothetical protein
MVTTVEHIVFISEIYTMVNRNIIYISIMTTELFYGRHHDLGNRYIISISLMTTDMFYGRHHVFIM